MENQTRTQSKKGRDQKDQAASLMPSDDEVMEFQLRPLAEVPVVSLVHVAPLSVEVQMSPPYTTAASLMCLRIAEIHEHAVAHIFR